MVNIQTTDQEVVGISDSVWEVLSARIEGRVTAIPGSPQAPLLFSGGSDELRRLAAEAREQAPEPPKPNPVEVELRLLRGQIERVLENQRQLNHSLGKVFRL